MNYKHNKDIKNVIFDLGGVICNIDYYKTAEAFRNLGIVDFNKHFSQLKQDHLFTKLELGTIYICDFKDSLRQETGVNFSDIDFYNAWNAMLLDTPKERIELLRVLKTSKKIFLMSNTNSIHIHFYYEKLKYVGVDNFKALFDKVYYSYESHLKKPDPEYYKLILQENNLIPDETLFIDDLSVNCEAAKALGIQTHHIKDGLSIVDLFE